MVCLGRVEINGGIARGLRAAGVAAIELTLLCCCFTLAIPPRGGGAFGGIRRIPEADDSHRERGGIGMRARFRITGKDLGWLARGTSISVPGSSPVECKARSK